MFDEEPDGDPHGECAAEIRRLQAEVTRLRADLAWAVAEAQSWRNEHPVALPSDAVFNARVAAIRASLQ